MALRDRPRRWEHWAVFSIDMYIYTSSYYLNMPISPFPVHPGRQEWVDGMLSVWMTSRLSYLRLLHD
jgi:hypothetical protein